MPDNNQIDPGHSEVRGLLRVIGLVLLGIGGLFVIVGLADFFSAAGHMGMPTKFHYLFIGMPLIFVGFTLTAAGFAGAVARYQAQEIAPVGKDTFNYMAEGTQEGVATIAGAIAEGLRGGGASDNAAVACAKCNTLNDADARFCKSCGKLLAQPRVCAGCGETNDPDALFCNSCGHALPV